MYNVYNYTCYLLLYKAISMLFITKVKAFCRKCCRWSSDDGKTFTIPRMTKSVKSALRRKLKKKTETLQLYTQRNLIE